MPSSIPIEYELFLNKSIQPIDGTLTDTSTPDQNGPGNNGNEEVLHITQVSRTGASSSDAV